MAASASIPEDAFYQDPFGIDEGDQVDMSDVDHDMFCNFVYLRHRFDISTDANGAFVVQWWPMMTKEAYRTAAAGVWTEFDPTWLGTLQSDYSHFRVMGAAIKVVPTMSQDTGKGEITAGMVFPRTVPSPTANQPQSFQISPGATPVAADMLTEIRARRGYVSSSAMSGLQVNYRHLKMFNPWYRYVPTETGTAPAVDTMALDCVTFDPHQFYPTWMSDRILMFYSQSGIQSDANFADMFPSLCVVGSGMPASQVVGTVEFVLGVCGVAYSSSVASRTPMPTFLGAPLTNDNLSNMPTRTEGLRRALTARAEARGRRIWETLDTASNIARSLAPLGAAVNPMIGAGLLGASAIGSAVSTSIRNFMSG